MLFRSPRKRPREGIKLRVFSDPMHSATRPIRKVESRTGPHEGASDNPPSDNPPSSNPSGNADGSSPSTPAFDSTQRTGQVFAPVEPGPVPESIGTFRIEGVLGKGGFGIVYRGRDDSLNRPVAIKILRASEQENKTDVAVIERFRREAQVLARVNHPNIIGIYQWGETEQGEFFAMELVEGTSLEEALKTRGRLDAVEAIRIAIEVSRGLRAA